MNTENTQKKRGRPKIDISWPDASFTVKDVMASMQNPPSNVLVHLKIKEGIRNGYIQQVGKKAGNTGRPQNIYKRVSEEQAPLS